MIMHHNLTDGKLHAFLTSESDGVQRCLDASVFLSPNKEPRVTVG
jgi:hypothetical protein